MSVHRDDQMTYDSDATFCEAFPIEMTYDINGFQLAQDTNNTTQQFSQEVGEIPLNTQTNNSQHQNSIKALSERMENVIIKNSQECELGSELMQVSGEVVITENSAGENTEINLSEQSVSIGVFKNNGGLVSAGALVQNAYLNRLRARCGRKAITRKLKKKKIKVSDKQTVMSDFYASSKIFIAQPFDSKVSDEAENISNGFLALEDKVDSTTNDYKKRMSNLDEAVEKMEIAKEKFLGRLLTRKQEMLSFVASTCGSHKDDLSKKKPNVYDLEEFTLSAEEALQNMTFLSETSSYHNKLYERVKYE